VTPSGKLGETWPVSLADTPCDRYYPGDKTAEYRESIFVGYRYYDSAGKEVAFPFGHGLSYTTFAYTNLKVSASSFKPGEKLTLTFTLKNTGTAAGAEAVQVYVAPRKTFFFRAEQELKAFEKIALEPGQEQTVAVELDTRSFAYYNTIKSDWAVESALYEIRIGASSRDIRLTATIDVAGDGSEKLFPDLPSYTPEYYNLKHSDTFAIRGATFRKLRERTAPFSLNSTVGEALATPVGQKLIPVVAKQMAALLGQPDGDIISMLEKGDTEMPLRSLLMRSIPLPQIEAFIAALNSGTIDKI
jgi:beta-glucosidase